MCTKGFWIYNRFAHKDVFVKCGKCVACQQEKATYRANRIRNNNSFGMISLFVTLTYDNESVPYIQKSDIGSASRYFKVYRDITSRRNRVSSSYEFNDVRTADKHILYELDALRTYDTSKLLPLKNKPNCYGVHYYDDLKMFFKRLRQNLKRHYNYEKKFSYFGCSEYGGSTGRPHFHALIFISSSDERIFRDTIIKSWPYADKYRTFRGIEVARDAASYVSSYVTKCGHMADLLERTPFKSKHSYSKGFGTSLDCFNLQAILRQIERGTMCYNKTIIKNGFPAVVSVPVPEYVLNRYFPKYKGFGLLPIDAVRFYGECPSIIPLSFQGFQNQYRYDERQSHEFLVRHLNAIDYYVKTTGKTIYDYSIDYHAAWRLRAAYCERLLHEGLSLVDYYQFYDNICEYLHGVTRAPTLDCLDKSRFIENPNSFKDRLQSDLKLSEVSHLIHKQSSVINESMAALGYDV